MSWENYLKNIYYNPSNPASLSGSDKLHQFVKKDGKYMISKYRIRKWLQREEAYSLQREARKPLKRSRIVVAGIDDQWSADLMDMVKFNKSNQGVRFILVVIGVFSKVPVAATFKGQERVVCCQSIRIHTHRRKNTETH